MNFSYWINLFETHPASTGLFSSLFILTIGLIFRKTEATRKISIGKGKYIEGNDNSNNVNL